MKQITLLITVLIILSSCSNKTEKQQREAIDDIQEEITQTSDTVEELITTNSDQIIEYSEYKSESNEIPPNGKYRFDIAFAEWQGKSMGETVTVIIKDGLIKVIYEGDGQLTLTEKGEVIDQGQLIKHKSGDWVISNNPKDKDLDEIGGCTDGPAIIDFKNKKYWMC